MVDLLLGVKIKENLGSRTSHEFFEPVKESGLVMNEVGLVSPPTTHVILYWTDPEDPRTCPDNSRPVQTTQDQSG